jgi:hypothetical protein
MSALDSFTSALSGTQYRHIHVIGYTDRIGSDEYNLKLWRQRADAATEPDECRAKRSPKTIACLQPDRRVEIEVSGEKRQSVTPIPIIDADFKAPSRGLFLCAGYRGDSCAALGPRSDRDAHARRHD